MNEFFDEFVRAAPRVADGLWTTVLATVLGAAAALAVAFALGLPAGSPKRSVRAPARLAVEFLRGTSLYVQLFWLFFALPVLGFRLEPLACGVLALGLNFGAYGAEVVRGAVSAVPPTQSEAAVALGMGRWLRLRRVVLPQAAVLMIPPFGNLLIQLLKATPLLSLITVSDLTFQLDQLRSATGDTATAYLTLLLMYFALAALLSSGMNLLESAAAARLGRRPEGGEA
ncbi:ectoine/hydroxyectoine ABC transporter permease subunit EhuC [Streptomyces globosus]|uniref:Ectoine/hydroxyectoine ABC transporter permease subunit EhuC n=1 Tax=Streptomyces globosus TaxID=68209 RepID=A0A344TYL6_9ACTN|nr:MULTISPECIES: ectoine/hydroxyectoine ABC transporter permease subunit EhuC [Streptomyces]AXE23737.1 ectoine/hydroxyectoine ABC transporter permease subunit EhuC [Streptomyces globosus]